MARRLRPDQLTRHLATDPPAGAYFVHGPEAMLRDEAVATLLDTLLEPGLRDFNLDLLSATQLEPEALAAACSTLPMMADRRVVVVRDIEAWKRKTKAKQPALQYLERPAPETVLVLVQGDGNDPDAEIAARSVAIDCATPTGDALDAWLDLRLASAQVTLTPDAREHLVRATGGDLGLLHAECGKLAGLGGGAALDLDTVGDLVGVRAGETVDDWRDAVLADDLPRAMAALPRVLEQSGVSGVKLVTVLGSSLLVLRWARATAEARKIRGPALAEQVKRLCFATRPGIGSYDPIARLIGEVVGRWSPTRLDHAVRATLAADVALKSTTVSGEGGILTDLVLSLAATRTRKAA